MFRVQKKLEVHFLYRAWTLVRATGYGAMVIFAVRALVPAMKFRDSTLAGDVVKEWWPVVAAFFVLELVGEKFFTWYSRPRIKLKKGEKPKVKVKAPPARVFYRRVTVSHLIPGRTNPVLSGLSEQDLEFTVPFRVFLALRYVVLVSTGLLSILVIAAEVIPRGDSFYGVLGALAPYFALKAIESGLLYLFLGKVMSGEDIHGARTTRFFAFEPTASFLKRLTLPIWDRKPWLVSLHPITNKGFRALWWLYRLAFVGVAGLLGQAAHNLVQSGEPTMTTPLSFCLPFVVFYLGLVLERALAYLLFFPAARKKKKSSKPKDEELRQAG